MHKTVVSFIIPALNEEKNIGNCIRSIFQFFPKEIECEILVGDHGSRDKTKSIAEGLGAKVCQYRGGTVGELRNFIVSHSVGKILIFLDADVSITAKWGDNIKDVISNVESDPCQITGSLCLVPETNNWLLKNWFKKLPKQNLKYLGTGHMIIDRKTFYQLDGFNKMLVSGEDYDICQRALGIGCKVVPQELLEVYHHDYPLTINDFVRREIWHGTGDFQSFSALISSKVAVLSVVFLALHIFLMLLLAVNSSFAYVPVLLIIVLISISSFVKFKHMSLIARSLNILIFYLYYLGRTLSFLRVVYKKVVSKLSSRRLE